MLSPTIRRRVIWLWLPAALLLAGCAGVEATPGGDSAAPVAGAVTASSAAAPPTATRPAATAIMRATAEEMEPGSGGAAPSRRPRPTAAPATATPSPSPTPLASPSPTATPVACDERHGDEGLLTFVTREYGLSRDYEPADLTPLSDYFDVYVTMGYATEVRAVIVEPLQALIAAMKAEGLRPQIVSGYRSYSEQSLAFQKWLREFPDWGSRLSAPPGHSEHQLGTTVDFGSPELKYMLGEAYVQFHPAFDQTSEGKWLAEHAAEYGFTLSYPEDGFERTTFYYEPWHFRYVGRELALSLAADGLALNEYLQREQPTPCRVE